MVRENVVQTLVLASQSPIRAGILRKAGFAFETRAAHVDEAGLIAGLAEAEPSRVALDLAEAKARAIAAERPEALVIGADQLLVVEGRILQKPANRDQARERLQLLSSRRHELVTGVILVSGQNVVWSLVDKAVLAMHELSQHEIEHHLAEEGDAILQSVGAYRLEGPGIRMFASLEGDYFAMLGLPLLPLISALRRHAPTLVPGIMAQ